MVSLVSCANCVRCEPPTWEDVASARLWCNPKSLWANRYAKQKYKQNICKTIYDMWSWSWSWDFRSTNRYWALGEQRGWSDGFCRGFADCETFVEYLFEPHEGIGIFQIITSHRVTCPFPLSSSRWKNRFGSLKQFSETLWCFTSTGTDNA